MHVTENVKDYMVSFPYNILFSILTATVTLNLTSEI